MKKRKIIIAFLILILIISGVFIYSIYYQNNKKIIINQSNENNEEIDNDQKIIDISKIKELTTGFNIDNPNLSFDNPSYIYSSKITNMGSNNLYITKIVIHVINADETKFGDYNIELNSLILPNQFSNIEGKIGLPWNESNFKLNYTVYGYDY